ncbi:hypothetical protein BD779DRAFT_1576374 [Infundibulicybe gibba]|nr:hypothetical protein BD779DRAFT_1576374 [Infundibulicybe gibba]
MFPLSGQGWGVDCTVVPTRTETGCLILYSCRVAVGSPTKTQGTSDAGVVTLPCIKRTSPSSRRGVHRRECQGVAGCSSCTQVYRVTLINSIENGKPEGLSWSDMFYSRLYLASNVNIIEITSPLQHTEPHPPQYANLPRRIVSRAGPTSVYLFTAREDPLSGRIHPVPSSTFPAPPPC